MLTDILVILDRSGSMQAMKADHEGGLQSFVKDQQDLDGDVRFTLVQFDTQNPCEVVYDRAPIRDVGAITLIPRGGTPLFDAIGKATTHLMEKQKTTPADQTIVMVITDGEENESREWSKDQVKQRITEIEKTGRAKVLYLGANVDAFSEAAKIGAASAGALNYAPVPTSVHAMYAAMSSNTLRSRSMAYSGEETSAVMDCMDWTDDQRKAILNTDDKEQ